LSKEVVFGSGGNWRSSQRRALAVTAQLGESEGLTQEQDRAQD
jgi:hypothetical protein